MDADATFQASKLTELAKADCSAQAVECQRTRFCRRRRYYRH